MNILTLPSLAHPERVLDPHTTAATIGLFDGVHIGHRHILNTLRLQAAATGRQTLVVTFEQHPQHELRPHEAPVRHIMSVTDRLARLEDAGIDHALVVAFTPEVYTLTSRQFMTLLRDNYGVDRLVVGFNNRFGSDTSSTIDDYRATGKRLGVTVVEASPFPAGEVSSTLIRRLIAEGRVAQARYLLGGEFSVTGTVTHGRHVGTGLGFPTANVGGLPYYQQLPAPGAYAVRVAITDAHGTTRRYDGMAGVGSRPTVSGSDDANDTTVEVNLFDFDGHDLYGSGITVYFCDKLRDQVKFDSLDALRAQLEVDRDRARLSLSRHKALKL